METQAALSAPINQNAGVCSRKYICVDQCRNLLNQETKKLVNFMLDVRRFVTEAGKLTAEGENLATGGW
jgi:predicted nucleic acid-binding Zn ribbon protein